MYRLLPRFVLFFVIAAVMFFILYAIAELGIFEVIGIISIVLAVIAFLAWIFIKIFALDKPNN
ncbi:MAG: hypothetical protein IJ168_11095 [Eubacterium sp.]|nr:hypothetical protein [Eubacterium sp.]